MRYNPETVYPADSHTESVWRTLKEQLRSEASEDQVLSQLFSHKTSYALGTNDSPKEDDDGS